MVSPLIMLRLFVILLLLTPSYTASAQVITIQNVSPIDFGRILTVTRRGTVTLDGNTGAITSNRHFPLGGHSRGEMIMTSDVRQRVIMSASQDNILRSPSGDEIILKKVTFDINKRFRADANVPYTIRLGGKIIIPANQPSGNYSGDFEITINYR